MFLVLLLIIALVVRYCQIRKGQIVYVDSACEVLTREFHQSMGTELRKKRKRILLNEKITMVSYDE